MTSDTATISYLTIRKSVLWTQSAWAVEDHNRFRLTAKWIDIFSPGGDPKTGKGGVLHGIVKGFLYFIDITDEAGLNQDNQRNLEIFKAIVGTEAMNSVIFVATKWAEQTERARRRQERRHADWENKVSTNFLGAHIMRLDAETSRYCEDELKDLSDGDGKAEKTKYHDNALKVLKEVLENRRVVHQIQKDVKEVDTRIRDTEVGHVNIKHVEEDAKAMATAGMNDQAEELLHSGRKIGLSLIGLVSTKEQQEALDKVYDDIVDNAVKAIHHGTELGATLGRPGMMLGGVVGGAIQAVPYVGKLSKEWVSKSPVNRFSG
ncbi:hypothetical protein BYT27DRAFT_7212971 [Phlegmacium glaucopus]|nr:hypothetical protein BYT27DRAFT_7212971 [Phlegmacium glaucopus]